MGIVSKFGRYYSLVVELRNDTVIGQVLTVQLPFTLEFDIERKNFGSANTAHFKIYNLNLNTRNSIRYDQFDMGVFRGITLFAGYDNIQPAIAFQGNISRAYSVREGSSFVTHIEAYDGGFAFSNANSGLSFIAGQPYSSVIINLVNDLRQYHVFPGYLGNTYLLQPNLPRDYPLSGSTTSLLKTETGRGFFIDNSKANILSDSECFTGTVAIIDASFGLLGTPYLEETFLMFDILFEPRLMVGQQIFLKSLSATSNLTDRQYKVIGLHHRGTISGAVCGDAVTTISCLYAPSGLSLVSSIA